jgi:branched-chain amino acid aminotransferase
MFASINNEIIPQSDASLHVSDLSIQRGYGVFDFFKVKDGHPYFLNDYLDRFYHSAAVMRLAVPLMREDLIKNIYAVIEKNQLPESGVKLILTGGYSPDGYTPGNPNLVVTQHTLSLPTPEVIEQGVKVITYEYVRDIPEVKTINYTMGIWLSDRVNQQQAADVLYVKDGIVSEFPRSNFFIVGKDRTVITPKSNILKGVTRKNILAIANDFGSIERDITLQEVYDAQEAFITSTTKRIVPITKVNDKVIGNGRPGAISLLLLQKLVEFEKHDRQQDIRPGFLNRF